MFTFQLYGILPYDAIHSIDPGSFQVNQRRSDRGAQELPSQSTPFTRGRPAALHCIDAIHLGAPRSPGPYRRHSLRGARAH